MITQSELKELLNYNPDTGEFTWLKTNNRRIIIGSIAGSNHLGYIQIKLSGKLYKAHRLAWLYITGEWPQQFIDHINHNRADNKWDNLREASNAENVRNSIKRKNNKSKYKGVYWKQKNQKWSAQICINYKKIYLGLFDSQEEGYKAYCEASKKYHMEFACFEECTRCCTIN